MKLFMKFVNEKKSSINNTSIYEMLEDNQNSNNIYKTQIDVAFI